MKAVIYSDLHCEFSEFTPPRIDIDLAILAGDIHVKTKGVDWAAKHFPRIPVLYVPGNHEYYRSVYPKNLAMMRERASLHPNICVLDQDHIEIGGIHFLGATLWTDFALFSDPYISGHYAECFMTDYKLIRSSPYYKKLRASDTLKIHSAQRAWLEAKLELLQGQQVVVITHHAPSKKSVSVEYSEDPLTPAYASHLDDLVLKFQPQYWIHGHMHSSSCYQIGNTTVICNPRGYLPDDQNPDFNATLIAEV